MKLFRVTGTEFPTPETVSVLAEVSEFRTGKDIGHSALTLENLARTVKVFDSNSTEHRQALLALAAHAIARIELIDNGRVFD